MWTMGYNEAAADSFNGGRKLRPLIPRLSSCPTAAANTNSDNRFNMVVTMNAEQNKRDQLMMLNSEPQHPPVMVSSRWNPTPDQLRVLEEIYRQGTRTPSADHIQQITAQLRRYGKIEGKNVFYWFQNHKARERQKRRRQMETGHEDSVTTLVSNYGFNKKDPPAGYKVEQNKNWICSVGCDTDQPEKPHDHLEEEPVYRRVERNGRCGGEEERRNVLGRSNSTCQMMHLPPGLYPSSHHPHNHNHHHRNLILNSTIVSSNISTSNSTDTVAKDTTTVSPVFIRTRAATNTETCNDHSHQDQEDCSNGELNHQEQTLELFPLRKEGFVRNGEDVEKEKESGNHLFYEFLPLKN